MINSMRLKQKVVLLVILPLSLIMLLAGTLGMRLISTVLLNQWEETAISKMQRSAHNVDMRLMGPKELLQFFQQNSQKNLTRKEVQVLIAQLRSLDGVIDVKYSFTENNQHGMKDVQRLKQPIIIPPLNYKTDSKSQTVSVMAQLTDINGTIESHIEVVVAFYDLVEQIVKASWWKGNKAYIVDETGAILATTDLTYQDNVDRKFGALNNLEVETWNAIQNNKAGTVFSPGMPPEMVSGFYHLQEAPWTIVVMAPGSSVLKPIITFKKYYYLICVIGVLLVAFYLWIVTNKTTRAVNRISKAANDLAQGAFGPPILVESKDEIGELTASFNTMSKQLKERLQLQQEMSIAGEIQANLLPQAGFVAEGIEIAVVIRYCDETGGDYVDIINKSHDKRSATVVVGDVVGHGVGASLLMTTLRALMRCRINSAGSLSEIINDVNNLLCHDTVRSGNFATLFCVTVDRASKTIDWVRCGHEPALVYCLDDNSYTELKGDGIALGIENNWKFSQNSRPFIAEDQIILVGTDGIWDVENPSGKQFGKERTQAIIAKSAHLSAQEITETILDEIDNFRLSHPQNDDITLAIIKTTAAGHK